MKNLYLILAVLFTACVPEKSEILPKPPEKIKDISIEKELICLLPIEIMPQYPGGFISMKKFINYNLKYPINGCMNGRVIVSFMISETGKLTDIIVLRGLSQNCNAEAIRIIQRMPDWIPGEQAGKPIPVRYTLPINFTLAK